MKKIITILGLAICCMPVAAQFNLGVQGGFNLTNPSIKEGSLALNSKSRMKYQVGVFTQIGLGKSISFRPGLQFIAKGFKVEDNVSALGYTYKTKYNLNYIGMPLLFTYNYSLANVKLIGGFGPDIAYAISGKAKTEITIGGVTKTEEEKIKIGNDKEDLIKPLDMGLTFLLGAQLKNGFGATLFITRGIANLDTQDSDLIWRNHSFGLSVTYLIIN